MAMILPENKETLFAYLTIHDFFDTYNVDGALRYVHSILKAAGSGGLWKKGNPYSALHFMQQLEKLCSAAYYITEHLATREAAVVEKEKRAANPPLALIQACTGRRAGENLWTCFPRHLRLQQFYDPYLAIKNFCHYKTQATWKTTFAELLEFALVAQNINNEVHPPYNLLNIQKHLSRLIEACHLLELRTNGKKI